MIKILIKRETDSIILKNFNLYLISQGFNKRKKDKLKKREEMAMLICLIINQSKMQRIIIKEEIIENPKWVTNIRIHTDLVFLK